MWMAHNQDQDKAQPCPRGERVGVQEEREPVHALADFSLRTFSIYLF